MVVEICIHEVHTRRRGLSSSYIGESPLGQPVKVIHHSVDIDKRSPWQKWRNVSHSCLAKDGGGVGVGKDSPIFLKESIADIWWQGGQVKIKKLGMEDVEGRQYMARKDSHHAIYNWCSFFIFEHSILLQYLRKMSINLNCIELQ